ncbi:hypothetical protein DL96DRAFT_1634704 [Flagelloscypha sp. PMI_526]|nr:hypothetical protein DL96DRAFT_1634704 [Flagelloscypha sp. PMI_526]
MFSRVKANIKSTIGSRSSNKVNFFNKLPGKVISKILALLSPHSLVLLLRVSHKANSVVSAYLGETYTLPRVLLPFFHSPEAVNEFQAIQFDTNCVITGSVALQFFEGATSTAEPLHIVVQRTPAPGGGVPIAEFLLNRCGYAYQGSSGNFGEDYEYSESEDRDFVFTTSAETSKRKVIMTVTNGPVMSVVLHQHSTYLMNIITRFTAVSLFPYETLELKETIATATSTVALRSLDKTRGYKTLASIRDSRLSASTSKTTRSDLLPRARRPGDERSFTISLLPASQRKGKRELYNCNSFQTEPFHPTKGLLQWKEVDEERFRFKYAGDPGNKFGLQTTIFKVQKQFDDRDVGREHLELDEVLAAKMSEGRREPRFWENPRTMSVLAPSSTTIGILSSFS